MLCCGLSEVFWTLLDPKGSEVLALWPLPQGGTATHPHRSCLTSTQPSRVPGSCALVRVRPPRGWTGCLLC